MPLGIRASCDGRATVRIGEHEDKPNVQGSLAAASRTMNDRGKCDRRQGDGATFDYVMDQTDDNVDLSTTT